MAKTQYWMTDGYGQLALIEGAEERDRWKPFGWTETDDLPADARVWMRHAEHDGRALFPAGAVELWQQKGWQPSDPPEPINPFNSAKPADVAEATPVGTPTTSPAPAGKANSNKSREQ